MSQQRPENQTFIAPSSFEPLSAHNAVPAAPKPHRRWPLAVLALVFISIMVFLFTARSLEINVIAETDADIELSGGLYIPFGKRYLLRQGSYQVHVQAVGYQPLETTVTVVEGDSQSLELALLPLPGKITFTTTPAGAEVIVDGTARGRTPLADQLLEPGDHQVLLQATDYLPAEQVLTVSGRSIAQQLEVALAPAWAEVTIDSEPTGAHILNDGNPLGVTPAVIHLLQGEQNLSLQREGFTDWQRKLAITAGQPLDLGTISLVPAAGVLHLTSSPSGANVTVNGQFEGQTPINLELAPGRDHRIATFKPGYRRSTISMAMAAGEEAERSIKLEAQLGEVQFNIAPAAAVLRVDGKTRGKGSQTLTLPAFEQSVEVVLDGHTSYRARITPRTGLKQVVNVTLQTEQESRMARIKPEITSALGQTLLLFSPREGNGDFTMGASRREPGRMANEVLHPVSLTRMFYVQTTEVTNAQFRLFEPAHNSGQTNGNSLNRDHQPVVAISWQQAAQFCNWLSKREGLSPFYKETNGIISGFSPASTGYRLPSEAEWAWVARSDGGSLKTFPWGDAFPPTKTVENYADNTSAYVTGRILNGYTDGHVVSAPVASFPANSKGLYDLGGNVAEWVHDVYSIPSANGSTATDPLGSQLGDNYVVRGASWTQSKLAELRLSHRDYGQAGRDDVGFRLARYAE